MAIEFTSLLLSFKIKEPKRLKEFVELLCFTEEKECGDIHFIFCSDEYLHKLNNDYLQHNTLTDIITFDYSKSNKAYGRKALRPYHELSGDLFISIERVKENALLFKQPFEQELHRVMFHGILHLCGYNDKLPKDIKTMRKKEAFYLELFAGS